MGEFEWVPTYELPELDGSDRGGWKLYRKKPLRSQIHHTSQDQLLDLVPVLTGFMSHSRPDLLSQRAHQLTHNQPLLEQPHHPNRPEQIGTEPPDHLNPTRIASVSSKPTLKLNAMPNSLVTKKLNANVSSKQGLKLSANSAAKPHSKHAKHNMTNSKLNTMPHSKLNTMPHSKLNAMPNPLH